MTDNRFNFFVEAGIDEEILKAAQKNTDDRYKNMIVYGMASDNTKDRQGEILEPTGYDFSDFLRNGLINLEHYTTRKGSAKYWIGEPIDAEVKDGKFFIRSKLWEKHPEARNLWDTLIAMQESGSKRRAGYSIEGQSVEKDPKNEKRITKAKISHCAITFSPVNSNSWIEIAKGEQKQDFIPITSVDDILYSFEYNGRTVEIDKSFRTSIKKSTDIETINPLKKESLQKKVIPLMYLPKIVKAIKDGTLDKKFFEFILSNDK